MQVKTVWKLGILMTMMPGAGARMARTGIPALLFHQWRQNLGAELD